MRFYEKKSTPLRIGAPRPPHAVRRPLPTRPRVGPSQRGPSRCGTAVSCAGWPPLRNTSSFQDYLRTTAIADGDTANGLGISTTMVVLVRGSNRNAAASDGTRRSGSAADAAMPRARGGGGSGGAHFSPPPPGPGEGGQRRAAAARAKRGGGTAREVGLLNFEFILWE